MKVKVSVIIPVYNVEKYLRKCLDSIVNQTLNNIEVIVINDGSIDNSQDIIDEYVYKYPNMVKSYVKENEGQGIARNLGIDNASGEYISFVDSDDWLENDALEKMYNFIKKEKSDICIVNQKCVDESDNFIKYDTFNLSGEFNSVNENKSLLFVNLGPCNKLFKRDLIVKNNFRFPQNKKMWYEDLPFVASCLIKAQKVCWLNEALYVYLQRENSTMNNSNIAKNMDIIKSFDIFLSMNSDNKFLAEKEFLCIDHVLIFTSVRIIKSNNKYKDKKKYLQILQDYIYEKYPNFEDNEYIKLLPLKRKVVFYLLKFKLYSIIMLMFKLKKFGR